MTVSQMLSNPQAADLLDYIADIAEEYAHFHGVLDLDGVSAGLSRQYREMARSVRAKANLSDDCKYIA